MVLEVINPATGELVKTYEGMLSDDEVETLHELLSIMRKNRPFWGL